MSVKSDQTEMSMQLIVKPPNGFLSDQKSKFLQLVTPGSQVIENGLLTRIEQAHFLAFLFIDEELVGTCAIKNNPNYRKKLVPKSGVSLPDADYFGEAGYLHVHSDYRGARYGDLLVIGTLAAVEGKGLFATIQAKNIASRRLFERHGFMQVGKSWKSEQQDDQVNLYVRNATRDSA